MVDIIDSPITSDEIQEILEWFHRNDGADDRGNARSKMMKTEGGFTGPYHIINNFLEKVVDFEPVIDKIIVLESRTSALRLHVDTDDNAPDVWGKNFLIPLQFDGPADTIWFNNYWYGPDVRFMRVVPDPYEYQLKDDAGNWYMHDDIREILKTEENTVYHKDGHDFTLTAEFLKLVKHIVDARDNGNISPRTDRYDDIINYDPTIKFDPHIQQEYMKHIPLENLHGLTLDKIITWKIGEAYMWDRSQLHTASSRHSNKIGLSIFVNRNV